MVAQLLPPGQITFLDDDGNPLSNGLVYFYIPSTTTFKNTWQDRGQLSLNTNPVQLDAAGRATIWGDGVYRQRVFDELGNEIWDKIVSTVDTSNNTGASGYYGGFTAVGGETSFSLVNQDGDSFTVATGAEVTLGVYINGVKLELANYSTDGSDLVTLINSTTLVAGDLVYYEQTGGINLNVPGPGTISGGQQFASTVTFDGVTVNADNATQFNFRDGSGLQIKNQGDATKIARFSSASLVGTRVFTFPDADTTLVGTDATQTLSNKTIASPTINGTMGFGGATLSTDNSSVLNLRDGSALNIANQGDATKIARFSAAGITAGATRTLSFPDASTTLVGTDATQTLTNKTITSATLAGTTAFPTAGVIDSSGRVIVGTNTALSSGSFIADLQAARAGSAGAGLMNYANSAAPVVFDMAKSRGATIGTQTIVNSQDGIGRISFNASDGTAFRIAARINAEVDGTPAASDMPGRIILQTCPDGSITPTDRLRVDNAGNTVLNSAAISTSATDGFLYIAACAGTPTGTPTTYTGRAPLVIDTTNNKLYFYSGGAWRDAGP